MQPHVKFQNHDCYKVFLSRYNFKELIREYTENSNTYFYPGLGKVRVMGAKRKKNLIIILT